MFYRSVCALGSDPIKPALNGQQATLFYLFKRMLHVDLLVLHVMQRKCCTTRLITSQYVAIAS